MSINTPPPVRRTPRPPRINIKGIHSNNGSAMGSMPPTAQPPYTAQTNNTLGAGGSVAGQPYWPQYGNPFAAGTFMSRGFEGFVDFTKSGMSFGEKFTYGLYDKFSKWSKKWFTHMFLFIVMALYTMGGALLFGAVESKFQSVREVQLLCQLRNWFVICLFSSLVHKSSLANYVFCSFKNMSSYLTQGAKL